MKKVWGIFTSPFFLVQSQSRILNGYETKACQTDTLFRVQVRILNPRKGVSFHWLYCTTVIKSFFQRLYVIEILKIAEIVTLSKLSTENENCDSFNECMTSEVVDFGAPVISKDRDWYKKIFTALMEWRGMLVSIFRVLFKRRSLTFFYIVFTFMKLSFSLN